MPMNEKGENTILFLSSYPPRECGIATFTEDLVTAIDKQFIPSLKTKILALDANGTDMHNYPKKVMKNIYDNDISAYMRTAKKINENKKIKAVSIQHEFGLYGGEFGDHVLAFLEALKKPIIMTFHSVVPNPNRERRAIVRSLAERVHAFVVMTEKAVKILQKDYEITIPIKVIPHGIPNVTFEPQKKYKHELKLKDKLVLCSFGMVSKNKGYEYVIRAMPKIIKKFPNAIYIIVGGTHPEIIKREGETYRNFLMNEVKRLGLEEHVKFNNKYLTKQQIIGYIKSCDLFISPSLTPEQITSGTLVYGMGCGRVVISTPFIHAKDILTENFGRLAKFKKSKSFANQIIELLSQPKLIKKMEEDVYKYTRQMTWENVAISYVKLFNKYLRLSEIHFRKIPKINISHLDKLTDDFGIIQFSNYSSPDIESGYTLDDNARAMIVCGTLYKKIQRNKQIKQIKTYLDYIKHVQQTDGKLLNIVDKHKNVDSNSWSEEAFGRAIHALGYITSVHNLPKELKRNAISILNNSYNKIYELTHPRAIASAISGIHHYNKENYSEKNIELIHKLAKNLVEIYEQNSHKKWQWFQPFMTYSNAKLSEALMLAYISTQEKKYLDIGKKSFDFLIQKTFNKNMFIPIGQDGWHDDKIRSYFDQQPIEAATMTRALILSYKIFQDPKYQNLSLNCFNWFLGQNIISKVVYNEQTGGCHDGIGRTEINTNQGAESSLAYLSARLALEDLA